MLEGILLLEAYKEKYKDRLRMPEPSLLKEN